MNFYSGVAFVIVLAFLLFYLQLIRNSWGIVLDQLLDGAIVMISIGVLGWLACS
jgi:hypothetical protein